MAQIGPNDPATVNNSSSVGTLSWSNTSDASASDDNYAISPALGTTQYLQATDFGFNLVSTDNVTGIQLDVEKVTTSYDVALLDGWQSGTNHAISGGPNRCFIVVIGLENAAGARDITGVTYGGVAMTQASEIGLTNAGYARIEVWYLLDAGLIASSGGTISCSISGTPSEDLEMVYSASFMNVDQLSPIAGSQTGTSSATGSTTSALSSQFAATAGSIAVAAIYSGSPNTFGINALFASQIDMQGSNPGFPTTGGSMMVAERAYVANTTSNPTFSVNTGATPSERVMIGFSIRRARNIDNSVRLCSTSGYVGNEKAVNTDWPRSIDAYTIYGGLGDLWGASWLYSDINNPAFGAGISAINQNGTVGVDHMRITVYTTSSLPVELIGFDAAQEGDDVTCRWITATETNTDKFIVERSTDGIHFEAVGTVAAAGRSESVTNYYFTDEHPAEGVNYYRLITLDTEGGAKESEIVSVLCDRSGNNLVFPNPANKYIVVTTNNGYDEIVITDMRGNIVDRIEGTTLQTEQHLNIEQMPDGAYLVWIKSHNGQVQVEKLVKASRNL